MSRGWKAIVLEAESAGGPAKRRKRRLFEPSHQMFFTFLLEIDKEDERTANGNCLDVTIYTNLRCLKAAREHACNLLIKRIDREREIDTLDNPGESSNRCNKERHTQEDQQLKNQADPVHQSTYKNR